MRHTFDLKRGKSEVLRDFSMLRPLRHKKLGKKAERVSAVQSMPCASKTG